MPFFFVVFNTFICRMINSRIPFYILPVITLAQFAGTSLWFATNTIMGDLQKHLHLPPSAMSQIASLVQFGCMTGTLLFAVFTIADKIAPRVLFVCCTSLGASLNFSILFLANDYFSLALIRFLTGICLAGILPIAAKTTANWFPKERLGVAMSYTIGALALGTAFPHAVSYLGAGLNSEIVIYVVSALAMIGGWMMFLFVPDGPYLVKATSFDWNQVPKLFLNAGYRKGVFGYFAHIWELFAFWAFLPLFLKYYQEKSLLTFNTSLVAYVVIASGFVGCVLAGYCTPRWGSRAVARGCLIISCVFCLLSPLAISVPLWMFIGIMILWGMAILADSPQFSTLVSKAVLPTQVGTGMTTMNCTGYAISIVSIQVLQYYVDQMDHQYLLTILAIGPLLGIMSLKADKSNQN